MTTSNSATTTVGGPQLNTFEFIGLPIVDRCSHRGEAGWIYASISRNGTSGTPRQEHPLLLRDPSKL